VYLRVENADTMFTNRYSQGEILRIPIAHGEGRFTANESTLDQLEGEGRVVFRYTDASGEASRRGNPNGSLRNIAGIINAEGNVLGLMPHPERAVDEMTGSHDGVRLFESIMARVAA
jgi:phosphoribosylformylglycinamidine synthase